MTLFEFSYLPTFYMTEPLKTLFATHKPKEGFKIMANQSVHTGRFVAAVFKDTPISRFSREVAEAAQALIVESSFETFESKLNPYITKR
jgi:hypothetical protein